MHNITDLEETLCSGTPGVHHPLRNTLPVELCKLLNQVIVLEQHRTCTDTLLLSCLPKINRSDQRNQLALGETRAGDASDSMTVQLKPLGAKQVYLLTQQ